MLPTSAEAGEEGEQQGASRKIHLKSIVALSECFSFHTTNETVYVSFLCSETCVSTFRLVKTWSPQCPGWVSMGRYCYSWSLEEWKMPDIHCAAKERMNAWSCIEIACDNVFGDFTQHPDGMRQVCPSTKVLLSYSQRNTFRLRGGLLDGVVTQDPNRERGKRRIWPAGCWKCNKNKSEGQN